MKTTVSRHGTKRIRQRCGIPKKSTSRLAELAFREGLDKKEVNGRLRRWLDRDVDLEGDKFVRLYRGKIYLFSEKKVLITILDVPGYLQRQLSIQTKNSKRR